MKGRILLLCILLAWVVGATFADASVLPARNNRIDFLNWEGTGVDRDPLDLDGDGNLLEANGIYDVGDTLRGILQAQNLAEGLFGLADVVLIGAGNPSLTAIFEIQLLAIAPAPGGGFVTTWGSDPAFVARNALPGKTMIAVYEEVGPGAQDIAFLPPGAAAFAATEATITDGVLLGAFGEGLVHEASLGPGTPGATYWIAEATANTFPFPAGGSAEFFYGMELLGGTLFGPPNLVVAQTSPFIFGTAHPAAAAHIGDLHDIVGEGDVTPLNPPNGVYHTFSDDPALVKVIPEPGSIVVWGLIIGSLGLACSIRRRMR